MDSDSSASESRKQTSQPTICDQFGQISRLVGVLRCNWYSPHGGISTFTFGSATLLSPQVILTCGHNVYVQSKKSICDEAIFIAGAEGYLSDNKAYTSKGYKVAVPIQTYKFKPVTEELALVVLKQPFEGEDVVYPQVGTISQRPSDTPVHMIGYPSKHYFSSLNLSNAYAEPLKLQGQVVSIDNHIINHTMPTKIGCSGAAIFAQPSEKQHFICGIHTHRGMSEDYNSGLYFTPQILNKLEQYFQELKSEFKLADELKIRQNVGDQEQTQDDDEGDDESNECNSNISCYDDIFEDQGKVEDSLQTEG